jgi:hypothetical protein
MKEVTGKYQSEIGVTANRAFERRENDGTTPVVGGRFQVFLKENFTLAVYTTRIGQFFGIAKRDPKEQPDELRGVQIAVSRAVYDSCGDQT